MSTQPEELTAAIVQTYVDRASETLQTQFNQLLALIQPVVKFAYGINNDKLRKNVECHRDDLALSIANPGKLYAFIEGNSAGLKIDAQFNDDGKSVLYMSNTPLRPGFGYPRGEITQQQAIEMVALMAALYEML